MTEDMKTAWQRGGAGGGGANPRPKVESTPPPVPMPSRYNNYTSQLVDVNLIEHNIIGGKYHISR